MFGIGSTELLVILVVALIVLGPKSLPGIAKTIGKAMGEFRRVSTEFQRTMNVEMEQEEHEKRKKQAEEELFGEKNAQASPHGQPQQQAPQAAQAPTSPHAEAHQTTVTVDSVQATHVEPAAPAVDPESPLGRAVAKAEAEAATAEPAVASAPASSPHAGPKEKA